MSGTDHTAAPDAPPVGLSFVLVQPQMGENIGAAARAMWNFGLDRMRIVAPRDGWPNPAAVAMASGAGRLLEEVAAALSGLEGLSAVGDRALADAAMTGLSHDITALEREGMEVDAEAKAGLEVAQLLRQFTVG